MFQLTVGIPAPEARVLAESLEGVQRSQMPAQSSRYPGPPSVGRVPGRRRRVREGRLRVRPASAAQGARMWARIGETGAFGRDGVGSVGLWIRRPLL